MNEYQRAWIYTRVDTQDKNDIALKLQETELCRHAQEQGYTVVGASVDAASGINLNRNGLKEMLGAAQHNQFDVLFVVSFNRLWRDTEQFATHLCQFQSLGLDVYSLKEGSANENALFGLDSAFPKLAMR